MKPTREIESTGIDPSRCESTWSGTESHFIEHLSLFIFLYLTLQADVGHNC